MALDQTQRFCPQCNSPVLCQRKGTNHLVHALVTLFLFGLWIPVWIVASMNKQPYRCTRCGTKV